MNIKKVMGIMLCVFSIISCGNKKKGGTVTPKVEVKEPKLIKVWETDSLMTTCEAVLYDNETQKIFVSNINNNPWEKDGNGFISIIDNIGDIENLKWVEGLSAPKGLGLYNGKLYVNDIDDLVEIDIKSQSILNRYHLDGNPQLNDITIDPEGTVYSSGSNSNVIYKLENEALIEVAKDSLKRLNGLLWQKEAMYYLDSGKHHFGKLNLETKIFKTLTTDIGHGDGIIRLSNGDFITSSWKGEVYYIYAKDWSKIKLLDTKASEINAADIDYIPESQLLLVPTFFNNRVVGYKLEL